MLSYVNGSFTKYIFTQFQNTLFWSLLGVLYAVRFFGKYTAVSFVQPENSYSALISVIHSGKQNALSSIHS